MTPATGAHGLDTHQWFEYVGTGGTGKLGAGVPDPVPPSPARAREGLRLLAVPDADAADALTGLPDPVRTPRRWRALVRCHRELFSGGQVTWTNAPDELEAAGRYFYVHLYLLALPRALEIQSEHGVPSEVVRATFADIGTKMADYRKAHGAGGFDRQAWAVRHFRGTLHRLGRLQFERATLDASACGGAPADGGPSDGEPVLDVHVPGDGPLTPASVDASFAEAARFFAGRFPRTRYRYATCHSWLLDTRLADYLEPGANILRFQSRFRPFGRWPVHDDEVLEFVFGVRPGAFDPDRLPARTRLQKGVLDRLRSGRHWHMVHGWCELPPMP
jgi:hypothetical protein